MVEAESSRAPLQFQITQLTQEKELAQKHSKWLNSELDRKSEDLLRERKAAAATELRIKSELAQSTEQVHALNAQLSTLRAQQTEAGNKSVRHASPRSDHSASLIASLVHA
jgi:hypothetical protein